MPMFFFHFGTNSERQHDEIGLDLPSLEAAYLQAVATAAGMAGELLRDGIDPASCTFEIEDAQGQPLLAVDFAELLRRRAAEMSAAFVTRRTVAALEETHRRATHARQELASSLVAARNSLHDTQTLLARLGRLEGR